MPLIEHPDNEGVGRCDMQLCPFNGKVAIAYMCGTDDCKKKVEKKSINWIMNIAESKKNTMYRRLRRRSTTKNSGIAMLFLFEGH